MFRQVSVYCWFIDVVCIDGICVAEFATRLLGNVLVFQAWEAVAVQIYEDIVRIVAMFWLSLELHWNN